MTHFPLRACVAEFFGAFTLTLVVLLTLLLSLPLETPLAAALTLMMFVYIVGNISGAHLNPAVTVGLFSIKKISFVNMLYYIAFQLIGAFVASLAVVWLAGQTPVLSMQGDIYTLLGEIIGALILTFAVTAVVMGNVPEASAGVVIGGALLVGLLVATSVGNGIINPAVAVGVRSISLLYLLGPLVGGVAGAHLYKFVAGGKKKK